MHVRTQQQWDSIYSQTGSTFTVITISAVQHVHAAAIPERAILKPDDFTSYDSSGFNVNTVSKSIIAKILLN